MYNACTLKRWNRVQYLGGGICVRELRSYISVYMGTNDSVRAISLTPILHAAVGQLELLAVRARSYALIFGEISLTWFENSRKLV